MVSKIFLKCVTNFENNFDLFDYIWIVKDFSIYIADNESYVKVNAES